MQAAQLLSPARMHLLRRGALALSLLVGLVAGVWVLASRELSDFLGEGPVRLFDVEDGARQALIGIGVLAATVVAGGITWPALPLWRYAIGGCAVLAALLLAPPLIIPMAVLYALAFLAELIGRTPPGRLASFAPRRHPTAWFAGGMLAVIGLIAATWISVWLLRPLWDEGKELNEQLAFEVSSSGAGCVAECISPPLGTASPSTPVPTPAEGTAVATPPPAANTGSILAEGQLEGTDSFHFGSGVVRLLRSPEGDVILRFEDYEVRNGPDLFVYLTPDPEGDLDVEGALDLGGIRATRGNVNYEVPAEVDPATFRAAVIWCRSFDVTFAVAIFE